MPREMKCSLVGTIGVTASATSLITLGLAINDFVHGKTIHESIAFKVFLMIVSAATVGGLLSTSMITCCDGDDTPEGGPTLRDVLTGLAGGFFAYPVMVGRSAYYAYRLTTDACNNSETNGNQNAVGHDVENQAHGALDIDHIELSTAPSTPRSVCASGF